ncbi:uncharacterized protein LOC114318723 [Camellia sinensis]|uniref:uncharacterized protein LOC114318723 n=1 Tax=Camellia sinensis TaxID=4442 RepID=UPI0010355E91|nr:uncharacterized protein LOC114318723 [Camellia sinensis]
MRMNPLKCAFGVTAGKFLGFLVHRHGIEADEDKVKSIRAMPPPHSQKELKKFLGKVSYIRRFIPALAEISAPFGSLLKEDAKFEWNQEHQKAFERIKATLTSPQTMIAPQPRVPLMLYVTSAPKSIGALLVQDVDRVERPVYYISRKIRGPEVRYTPIERHCLALVFTTQKLRHYFLAHQIQIVTRSDPIRYLLSKPALTGKVARWLLALGEFEITCVAPKAIKSQALADLLAQFPNGDYKPVNEELREEVHAAMASEESFWTLSFDGAAAGAEYEALILGLIAVEKHSIKKIRIRGDSKLIVKQKVEIEHVPHSDNKFSDALATLGARVDIPEEEATIIIKKRTEPSIIPEDKDLLENWKGEVLEQLRSKVGKLTMAKLAQFIIIQGELYFRGGTGFLAQCVGQQEASFRLQQIHEKFCRDGDISLYRRIQKHGYDGFIVMENCLILMCKFRGVTLVIKYNDGFNFKDLVYKLCAKWSELVGSSMNISYSMPGHFSCGLQSEEDLEVIVGLALSCDIHRIDVFAKGCSLGEVIILSFLLLESADN